MPRKFIHVHVPECDSDYWFCQSLDWWARGKCPLKGQIDAGLKRAAKFINGCDNDDLKTLNLVCVPLKKEESSNPPPRIGVSKSGQPEWKYERNVESEESGPSLPPRCQVGNPWVDEGVDTPTDTPSAMAAYVKGALEVGEKLHEEIVGVIKSRRQMDRQWRMKTAKQVVRDQVFGESAATYRQKRKIDREWQAKMDEWNEAKRKCKEHYDSWRCYDGGARVRSTTGSGNCMCSSDIVDPETESSSDESEEDDDETVIGDDDVVSCQVEPSSDGEGGEVDEGGKGKGGKGNEVGEGGKGVEGEGGEGGKVGESGECEGGKGSEGGEGGEGEGGKGGEGKGGDDKDGEGGVNI